MRKIFLAFSLLFALSSTAQQYQYGTPILVEGLNFSVAEYDLPGDMTLIQALQTCASLSGNWRLPTFDEIRQFNNIYKENGLKKSREAFYWTSSIYNNDYRLLYYPINDIKGYGDVKNGRYLVRLVSDLKIDDKVKIQENNILKYIREADINDNFWKKYWNDIKTANMELFASKGEFEKTAEYESRLVEQADLKKVSYKEYLTVSENLKNEERIRKETAKNNKIKESLKSVKYSIKSIGNYDADNERFEIRIEKSKEYSDKYSGSYVSKDFVANGKIYSIDAKLKGDSLNMKLRIDDNTYEFVLARESEQIYSGGLGNTNIKLKYFFNYNANRPYNVELSFGSTKSNWVPNQNFSDNYTKNESTNMMASIHVPIAQAPSFKQRYSDITIEGFEMLEEDLVKTKTVNLVAVFEDERYLIGKQIDLSANLANIEENYNASNATTSKIKAFPKLTATVSFEDENENSLLDGGETSNIKITILNEGEGPAQGINIKTLVDNELGLVFKQNTFIGAIEPNTEKTIAIPVKSLESILSSDRNFKIDIKEANGFNPLPIELTISTKELIKPTLVLKEIGIENSTSKLPVLKQSETSKLTFRIQNNSLADAKNIVFNVQLPNNVFLMGGEKQIEVPVIKSGEILDIPVDVAPNNLVNNKEQFKIAFSGKYLNGVFSEEMEIENNKTASSKVVISGKNDVNTYSEVYSADLNIDIEKDIPSNNNINRNAIAVVLGIEKYKNVGNVSFAARDASIVKEYFNKTLGIPTEQIYFKLNGDVTKGEMEKIFGGWLQNRVDENTSVYVYYAGHGAPAEDENAYLIPNDGDPNYADITGYSLNSMYSQLGKLPTDKITVFLDACFSGQDREQKLLINDTRGLGIKTKNAEIPEKINVFSASSSDQVSNGWPDKKHGLFTYFMLKGIKGSADKNNDNQITFEELSEFISINVEKQAGYLDRKQKPESKIVLPLERVF
jgi:hypothetical protein